MTPVCSSGPSVTIILDIIMALGCAQGTHICKAAACFGRQHDFRFQSRSWVSVLPSVVTGATYVNTVPACGRTIDLDVAFD